MQIAKTGEQRDSARHSTRSFADVWNTPLQTKIEEGNILIDLGIKEIVDDEGISDVIFEIKYIKDDYYPNFRAGDTVFVYKRNGENDNATNRQVIRGTLSSITPEALTLHLRHKQRNSTLFDKNTHYAIEHDHLDSTFRASIRDLYSLLSAPKQRTGLILAQREPTFNTSLTLNGDYGNSYITTWVLDLALASSPASPFPSSLHSKLCQISFLEKIHLFLATWLVGILVSRPRIKPNESM